MWQQTFDTVQTLISGAVMSAMSYVGLYTAPPPSPPAWGGYSPFPDSELTEQVRGLVRSEANAALEGVQVVLGANDRYVLVRDGYYLEGVRPETCTDEEGRFTLRAPEAPFTLLALHETGYAMQVIEHSAYDGATLTLRPWARADIQVLHDGLPVPKVEAGPEFHFSLDSPVQSMRFEYHGKTGADGRVLHERVPDSYGLLKAGKWEFDTSRSRSRSPVRYRSGETVQLTIGGEGLRMSGRIESPGGEPLQPKQRCIGGLMEIQPGHFPPDGLDEQGEKKYWASWSETEEGKASQFDRGNTYSFEVDESGHFSVANVLPGKYIFSLQLHAAPGHDGPHRWLSGAYRSTVDFTASSDGLTDTEVDLGTLKLAEVRGQKGDLAPDFAFTTVEGAKHKLSDFRGRYVLLDFWWPSLKHKAYRAYRATIRELHDRYAATGQFTIIGLATDFREENLLRYLQNNPLPWPQTYLGEQWTSIVKDLYEMGGAGSGAVLIGPDGRIVVTDLFGPEMKKLVDAELKSWWELW